MNDTAMNIDEKGIFDQFQSSIGFPLDPFQEKACQELIAHKSILVCAPTGAGKTIVGHCAVHLALAKNTKCYYTTPIKALSNQKYDELVRIYGADNIGLLTGDSTINPQASVIVMTTEILRNMIYEKSEAIAQLSYVVMDEVHYLADRFRGGVWEEVMLQLPEDVRIVSLSATVSNAEEFGAWIQKIRGETSVIVDEHRPVPLYQHMLVRDEIIPIYERDATNSTKDSPEISPRISPRLEKVIAQTERAVSDIHFRRKSTQQHYRDSKRDHYRNYRHQHKKGSNKNDRRTERANDGPTGNKAHFYGSDDRKNIQAYDREFLRELENPNRTQIISLLSEQKMLPVIYFIFSRSGCDMAVNACLNSDIELNPPDVHDKIDAVIYRHLSEISDTDLDVIGFHQWRQGLYRGFAVHHAGIFPAFRRVVEELFSAGLLKVVFATETLALGINMPAKSVVVEKLIKYNGEQHVDITPGEFTQLCGRAGRRGIDTEGHAVICWRPGMRAQNIATLAGTRTFPLNSSFMPMYNMTLNLVHQFSLTQALHLIERSFAQFQQDYQQKSHHTHALVDISTTDNHKADKRWEQREDAYQEICRIDADLIDLCPPETTLAQLHSYIHLYEQSRIITKEKQKISRVTTQKNIHHVLSHCQKYDIIYIGSGRRKGFSVIVKKFSRNNELMVDLINSYGKKITLSATNLTAVPHKTSEILPEKLRHNLHTDRGKKSIGKYLQKLTIDDGVCSARRELSPMISQNVLAPEAHSSEADVLAELTNHALHPIFTDQKTIYLTAPLLRKRRLLQHFINPPEEQYARNGSLERVFINNVRLLAELDYLSDTVDPQLTESGQMFLHIYSESDLVIAQCLGAQLWENLHPAELAAVVSILVYESRNDKKIHLNQLPELSSATRAAIEKTIHMWRDITELEESYHLRPTREPDLGFAAAIYRWAGGAELSEVLYLAGDKGQPQAAGDFLRWSRQVIDVLDQISQALPSTNLATTARIAGEKIKRGIVCAGLLV